jgi:hypothetical protein
MYKIPIDMTCHLFFFYLHWAYHDALYADLSISFTSAIVSLPLLSLTLGFVLQEVPQL